MGGLTLLKLNKEIKKLIGQGYGRSKVMVSKTSFYHPLEGDGCTILPVEEITIDSIGLLDGDGFTKYRKSGEECSNTCAVLKGGGECTDN